MKIEGLDTKELAQRVAYSLMECWYINHYCISYSEAKQSYTLYFYDIDHVPTRVVQPHARNGVPTQHGAQWCNQVYEEMG